MYFFLCILFTSFTKNVFAADYTVFCTATTCTSDTIADFFPASEVWYPGKSFAKTLKITNSSGSSQRVVVEAENIATSGNLDQVIHYTITNENKSALWDNSLHAFYANGETLIFDSLADGATQTFTLKGLMYSSVGNEYQGKFTQHDLTIGFLSYFTPKSPTCTDAKPTIPGPITISRLSDSEITLAWERASGTVTGYKITWSKDMDIDGEGEGTRLLGNTTEETIDGLDLSHSAYYFKVRALNDCKEGDASAPEFAGTKFYWIISPTPSPTSIATPTPSIQEKTVNTVAPTNERGQVEGAQTSITRAPTQLAHPSATITKMPGTPSVKGATLLPAPASQKNSALWWKIMVGEIITLTLYYFFVVWYRRKKRKKK